MITFFNCTEREGPCKKRVGRGERGEQVTGGRERGGRVTKRDRHSTVGLWQPH